MRQIGRDMLIASPRRQCRSGDTMSDNRLEESARSLEQLLADLEAAKLSVAAAHISTALELLQREIRRLRKPGPPDLTLISGGNRRSQKD